MPCVRNSRRMASRWRERDCAELVIELARQKILVLADLLNTFMKHAKAADLSVDDMLGRAGTGSTRERSERFLTIYETVQGTVRAAASAMRGHWTSLTSSNERPD